MVISGNEYNYIVMSMPFIISLLAGLSTTIGCIPMFLNIKKINKFITFSLAFSLSVMLSISIFDLIPSSLPYIANKGFIRCLITLISFFAIGFIIVNILNKLIEREKGSTNNLYKLGILSSIALIIHNFPEGILTFLSSYQDIQLGISICIAIAFHNIPEGISIALPIYYATGNRKKAFLMTLFSGLAEPLGAILAYVILKRFITNEMISIFLVLVAGIMTTLAIEKILPEALSYKEKKHLYLGLFIGVVIVIFSIIIL